MGVEPRSLRRGTLTRLLLLLALCYTLLPAGAATARGPTVAVALGDSFISGQAGRWEGNSTDPFGSRSGTDRACVPAGLGCRYETERVYLGGTAPPGCARSDVAEIVSARVGVQETINLACSGAETKDVFRGSSGGQMFKGEAPQADQLARVARERTIRLIVLSIGGNDIGFEELVTSCVLAYATRTGPCRDAQRAAIDARLPQAMTGVAKAISEVRAVMRAAGYRPWNYRFVLQSYPSPVPRAADNRYPEAGLGRSLSGGCPFYDADSDFARNSLVPLLDENLKAVAVVSGVQFLSLRNAFEGREVCSRSARVVDAANPPSAVTSEWARAVGVGTVTQGTSIDEVAHPNAFGQRALGQCLTLLFARPTGSWACKNTLGRGTEAMSLARASALPDRFRMALKVSPRRVVAGRRTCFSLRVLSTGQPVEGVTVRLAGTRGRTSASGRVRRCARLRAGDHRVRATRPGFRGVSVIVRARRGR